MTFHAILIVGLLALPKATLADASPADDLRALRTWLGAAAAGNIVELQSRTAAPFTYRTTSKTKKCEGKVHRAEGLIRWLSCFREDQKLVLQEIEKGVEVQLASPRDADPKALRRLTKSVSGEGRQPCCHGLCKLTPITLAGRMGARVDEAKAVKWLGELEEKGKELRASKTGERAPWASLFSEMHAALESVFPPSHVVLRRWTEACARGAGAIRGNNVATPEMWVLDELLGIFDTSVRLIKEGHLRRFIDGIRIETIEQCLDQAEHLANSGVAAAAMVLAGGGLEVHLRNLCGRFSLTWTGDGSISKYNQSLGQARNQGLQSVVTASDSNLIESWGKDRNEAAHTPTRFAKDGPHVLLTLQGIRQFMARTA